MSSLGDLQIPEPGSVPETLIDVAQFKALLGITSTTIDEQLTFSLEIASALIQSYTGRLLVFQTYEEKFTCPPQRLGLREFPVKLINSVTDDRTDYALVRSQGVITFAQPVYNMPELVINYDAGYEKMPADLTSVLLELGKRQLQAMGVDDPALASLNAPTKSVNVGSLRVDYLTAASLSEKTGSPVLSEVIAQYADVLDRYQHPRILAATP